MHIGVFYSHGPHFMRVLRTLREQHPDARITAFVPEKFPTEIIRAAADTIISVPPPPYGLRRPDIILALIRILRAQHPDRFVVMFDSLRLRWVARASGAREGWFIGPDGAYQPLRTTGITDLTEAAARRSRGTLLFLRIWWNVHTTRVKP